MKTMENQTTTAPFEIEAQQNNSILKPEETAEQRIKEEIKRFSLPDQKIAEMKEKFGGLTIRELPAPEDKDGLKAFRDEKETVRKALAIVRGVRTGLEKKRKELKSDYLAIGKGIDAEAKRLSELVEPIENPLQEALDAAEQAEDFRKKEAERLEQERLQGRVTKLIEAGIKFDGSFYSLEDVSVDVMTLKTIPDDKFAALLGRVAEIKARLDAAELEKAKADQEEKDRIQREQDQLKADQLELQRQQDALNKQKEDLAKEAEAARAELIQSRRAIIESLGLCWNPVSQYYSIANPCGRVSVEISEITEASAQGWTDLIVNVKGLVADIQAKEASRLEDVRLQEEETKRKEEVFTNRLHTLQGLGFMYAPGFKEFSFAAPFTEFPLKVQEAFVRQLEEDQFGKEVTNWTAAIADMKEKSLKLEREEIQRAEKLRTKALSEEARCSEYFDQLLAIQRPEVTVDPGIQNVMKNFFRSLEGAAEAIKNPVI